MSIIDRLKAFFNNTKKGSVAAQVANIDVPDSAVIKALALYCGESLIANAVSQCEIKCVKNGKLVKDEDYYSLNIKANVNESGSQFWHKVVHKALTANPDYGALVITVNGKLLCADSYTIQTKDAINGNTYTSVIVDDTEIEGTFSADEVLIFRLENRNANYFVSQMYGDFDKAVQAALSSFKNSNASKYVLNVPGVQAGDEAFNTELKSYLEEPINKYINGDTNVWIQYEGRSLEPEKNSSSKQSSDDFVKLVEEVFKMTAKALKIPESLMLGNITNMKDVVNEFLTFGVEPFTEMIGNVLTAQFYTSKEYAQGNYFWVDTSKIAHLSVTELADAIDKLRSSSFMSINEIRKLFDMEKINEAWADEYVLTKNYAPITGTGKEANSV